jgi:CspA family cold shock protein
MPGSIIVSSGTVKWFNSEKGYGFITDDEGGTDLFVHHSEIKTAGYAGLDQGQKVDYEVGQGKKGPCATNVVPKQI